MKLRYITLNFVLGSSYRSLVNRSTNGANCFAVFLSFCSSGQMVAVGHNGKMTSSDRYRADSRLLNVGSMLIRQNLACSDFPLMSELSRWPVTLFRTIVQQGLTPWDFIEHGNEMELFAPVSHLLWDLCISEDSFKHFLVALRMFTFL